MASNLRVDQILPSTSTNVAIGTATGTVTLAGTTSGTFSGNLTGNINATGVSTIATLNVTQSNPTNLNVSGVTTTATLRATSIVGVTTAGITTAYIGAVNDGPISGARNRIINGDMRIDQRNNGASVSVTGDGFGNRVFPVDRFNIQRNSTCVISGIQTSDVPTGQGFSNALKAQVTTADASIAAADYAVISHRFEGYNVADLQYGTANAKTATLSFWVKSSISGTYCVSLTNYADSRGIPINYSINSPDTWEYKTITISGDTTGTWEKTNSGGMNMAWTLGAGTDYQATNNTWTGSVELATSSQTQWISTLNATFYLTGVQLEAGTVATPFERRSFGQELALCQRYYYKCVVGFTNGYGEVTNIYSAVVHMPVPMRAQPSVTNDADTSGIASGGGLYNMTANSASIPNNWWSNHHMLVNFGTTTQMTRWASAYGRLINFQAAAEL